MNACNMLISDVVLICLLQIFILYTVKNGKLGQVRVRVKLCSSNKNMWSIYLCRHKNLLS